MTACHRCLSFASSSLSAVRVASSAFSKAAASAPAFALPGPPLRAPVLPQTPRALPRSSPPWPVRPPASAKLQLPSCPGSPAAPATKLPPGTPPEPLPTRERFSAGAAASPVAAGRPRAWQPHAAYRGSLWPRAQAHRGSARSEPIRRALRGAECADPPGSESPLRSRRAPPGHCPERNCRGSLRRSRADLRQNSEPCTSSPEKPWL